VTTSHPELVIGLRCISTVFNNTKSDWAIWRLLSPLAARRATRRSVGVGAGQLDAARPGARCEHLFAPSLREQTSAAPVSQLRSGGHGSRVAAGLPDIPRRSAAPRSTRARAYSKRHGPARCVTDSRNRATPASPPVVPGGHLAALSHPQELAALSLGTCHLCTTTDHGAGFDHEAGPDRKPDHGE
jgi:hypothetical protein